MNSEAHNEYMRRWRAGEIEPREDTFDQYVTDVAMGRRAGEQVWPT